MVVAVAVAAPGLGQLGEEEPGIAVPGPGDPGRRSQGVHLGQWDWEVSLTWWTWTWLVRVGGRRLSWWVGEWSHRGGLSALVFPVHGYIYSLLSISERTASSTEVGDFVQTSSSSVFDFGFATFPTETGCLLGGGFFGHCARSVELMRVENNSTLG